MNTIKITPEQISKAVEVIKKLRERKIAFREAVTSGHFTEYAKQQQVADAGTTVPRN